MGAPTTRLPLLLLLLLLAVGLCLPTATQAARILGIFPSPSISHQLPYQAVMKALAARGHQITVISPDPLKEPVANYTDIDVSFLYKTYREVVTYAGLAETDTVSMMQMMAPGYFRLAEEQLQSKQVQDFLRYNASQGFDLVFFEWWGYESLYGIVHAVGSPPMVGILSFGGSIVQFRSMGNPHNPAVNPDVFTGFSDHMTFWERVQNLIQMVRITRHWEGVMFPGHEKLLRKYFGSAPPPVYETSRNLSLLIFCNHWTFEYPHALLPNVLQVTGAHVSEKTRPLPTELHKWIDDAGPHGVVYFSLGTNVLAKDLPAEKLQGIMRALGRLKQRVLWKFELETVPGLPPNVRVSKWLPQQEILAHPNIRLFITQGGLQSLQEAVYHAVPMLGIPFYGDQNYNTAKMVRAGIGTRIEFKDITEETFYAAITEMFGNNTYAERMRSFSAVYRDQKTFTMDTALWWVEYVLRHKGAPHLRSGELRLAWYELQLLDVAAAAVLAVVVVLLLAAWALRRLLRALRPAPSQAERRRKDQ